MELQGKLVCFVRNFTGGYRRATAKAWQGQPLPPPALDILLYLSHQPVCAISIDGTPIDQLSRKAVHGMFGMVLQDTWLFEGTVRENLVYNLRGVTDEQLERVCQVCGVDQFVHTLPEGFDTVLSESTTISAGQKQLFTIARAMLQNNPMLILDEATSSVDTRTELLIQRAMDALTQGRTSFVIAHRLSTIKNADIILVMQEGGRGGNRHPRAAAGKARGIRRAV